MSMYSTVYIINPLKRKANSGSHFLILHNFMIYMHSLNEQFCQEEVHMSGVYNQFESPGDRDDRKDDRKELQSDRRKEGGEITREGTLKGKEISAPNDFKASTKKETIGENSKKGDEKVSSEIEVLLNSEELKAVQAFRLALINDNLLPGRFYDQYLMLRTYF